eukprot:scaffold93513_cov23-Tisochrysis_lutea.AAC.1
MEGNLLPRSPELQCMSVLPLLVLSSGTHMEGNLVSRSPELRCACMPVLPLLVLASFFLGFGIFRDLDRP